MTFRHISRSLKSLSWPILLAGALRLQPRHGDARRPQGRGRRSGRSRSSRGACRPSSSSTSPRRPASTSSTTTAPSGTSSCPRRWARASPFSTMTATATRTCSSSTRRTGPATQVKPAPTQALYRNDGKGHFEDVTKEAGLDKTFYGQGVAVGDYDNDGDPDLYVTAIGGGHLFRNDGKGHFDDVTAAANAKGPNGWLTGAAFLDIDNDGDLDLFIGNYITWTPEIDKVQGFQLTGIGRAYGPPTSFNGSFCALLRNDGGAFTDISEPAGIQVRTPDLKVPVGKSLGVAPYDVDGDGLVDIAVANDTVQNFFFHNKGDGQVRGDRDTISGVAFDQSGSPRGGMGIDWASLHERRPAGPGRRQLRQRDDGPLRLRPAVDLSCSRTWPTSTASAPRRSRR